MLRKIFFEITIFRYAKWVVGSILRNFVTFFEKNRLRRIFVTQNLIFQKVPGPVTLELTAMPVANNDKCDDCKEKFCGPKTPGSKFYSLCNNFDKCYNKYPPYKYSSKTSDFQYKLNGQKCWGKPFTQEYQIKKEDHMTTEQFCKSCLDGKSMSYPKYQEKIKKCLEPSCDQIDKDYDVRQCEEMTCSKACLNGAGYSRDCLICKYGIEDPRPDTNLQEACEKTEDPQNCLEALSAFVCYSNCDNFAKFRNLRGKEGFDHNKYYNYMQKCKQSECDQYFPKKCGICIDQCAAQGEREYTSALGTNSFRKNYEGWGCLDLCKCKNMINLAKTDSVKVEAPEALEVQAAVGIVSGNVATMISNKRKKQKKRKRTRRPSRRRL